MNDIEDVSKSKEVIKKLNKIAKTNKTLKKDLKNLENTKIKEEIQRKSMERKKIAISLRKPPLVNIEEDEINNIDLGSNYENLNAEYAKNLKTLIYEFSKPSVDLQSGEKIIDRNLERIEKTFNSLKGMDTFYNEHKVNLDIMKTCYGVMTYKFYEKGSVIFKQGDNPDGFYGIILGKVKLLLESKLYENEITLLSILKEGECFGERGIINYKPRSASAVAEEDSHLYFIKLFDFRLTLNKQILKMEALKRDFVYHSINHRNSLEISRQIFNKLIFRKYKKNELVQIQGNKSNSSFLIFSGSVLLITKKMIHYDFSRNLNLITLQSGSFFGGEIFIDIANCEYSVLVLEDFSAISEIRYEDAIEVGDHLKKYLGNECEKRLKKINSFVNNYINYSEKVKPIYNKEITNSLLNVNSASNTKRNDNYIIESYHNFVENEIKKIEDEKFSIEKISMTFKNEHKNSKNNKLNKVNFNIDPLGSCKFDSEKIIQKENENNINNKIDNIEDSKKEENQNLFHIESKKFMTNKNINNLDHFKSSINLVDFKIKRPKSFRESKTKFDNIVVLNDDGYRNKSCNSNEKLKKTKRISYLDLLKQKNDSMRKSIENKKKHKLKSEVSLSALFKLMKPEDYKNKLFLSGINNLNSLSKINQKDDIFKTNIKVSMNDLNKLNKDLGPSIINFNNSKNNNDQQIKNELKLRVSDIRPISIRERLKINFEKQRKNDFKDYFTLMQEFNGNKSRINKLDLSNVSISTELKSALSQTIDKDINYNDKQKKTSIFSTCLYCSGKLELPFVHK